MEEKIFATCEWVDEETGASLWWTTSREEHSTGLSFFKDYSLLPYRPIAAGRGKNQYSTIYVFPADAEFGLKTPDTDQENKVQLSAAAVSYLRPYRWDGIAKELLDFYGENIDQGLLEVLFHEKTYRQINFDDVKLPFPRWYRMTACLRQDWTFALISNKWKPGERPEWFTFHNQDFAEFRRKLNCFEIICWRPDKDNFYPLIPETELEEFGKLIDTAQ